MFEDEGSESTSLSTALPENDNISTTLNRHRRIPSTLIVLVRNLQTIEVGSDAIFSSMQDALKGGLQEALILSFSCQGAG